MGRAHIAFAGDGRDWEWRGMPEHPESAIGRNAESTERRARTTAIAILAAAQNGTYACGRRTGDHCCEAHDRSVAVRPGALATGSVV
jgi:hypothetical protein